MSRLFSLTALLVLLCLRPLWAQPVEVSIFEGGEGLDFYRQVAREFTRLSPHTPIRLDGDPKMADRLRLRVLEGDQPEVTNADINVWSLIEHGRIMPLDPWLDGPNWDGTSTWRQSFLPGSLEPFTYHGKTYGVPLVYVVWSVYYNKALFRDKGWSPATTWPEFLDLCQTILSSGLSPLAFQGRYPFYAKALIQHTYYHLAGPKGYAAQTSLAPGSFHNPAMVKALSFLTRLSAQYFEKGSLGMSHTEAQLEFFQGRAAMLFCGSWLFSEMRDNIPSDFELGAFSLPLPVSSLSDPGAGFATSGSWFVFKDSQNPEGGADFLRFLTSRQVAGKFAAERGMTVAVQGANADLHPMMSDVARQLGGLRRTFGSPTGQVIPGMDQVWNDVLQRLMAGQLTAEKGATELEDGARSARRIHENPDAVEARHPVKTVLFLTFLLVGLMVGSGASRGIPVLNGQRTSALSTATFLAPALGIYTLFFTAPALVAFLVSGCRWDGLGEPRWVGVTNFSRLLLESDGFWIALSNNLYLMLVIPFFVLPLSLVLAALLDRGVWGSRLFRIAFFFPNLLGVAGILLWQQLYNPQGGPINVVLTFLGLGTFDGFAWLSPQHLYLALVPMGIWGACGFNMVLFLAAMQGVSTDLYEVAELYGASAWEKFRFVTFPSIRGTVAASTIFMLIGGMKAFEAIWLLTNQSPSTETHVVGTLMVRSMFVEQRMGQAAAIACLLFAIVLVGSLLIHRISDSDVTE